MTLITRPRFASLSLRPWALYQRRTFFKLPELPFASDAPNPQSYHERKTLPYTRAEMYSVVSDVASYRHFIPFCENARVLRTLAEDSHKLVMDAELTVGFNAFKESYASRVTCIPHESVQADASSSTPLFKTLVTTWRFQPAPLSSITDVPAASTSNSQPSETTSGAGPTFTVVTLDLSYQFANPIYAAVSATFFDKVSKMMVEAFEKRCRDLYGRRNP